MIRVYQAQHGGLVFENAPTRAQKTLRHRIAAVAVIVAVAASAGLLQHFSDNPLSGLAAPVSGTSSAAQ